MRNPLIYPIFPEQKTLLEKLAINFNFSIGYCPVCGCYTIMKNWMSNLRDSGWCIKCKASNRQRQMAILICNRFLQGDTSPIKSLQLQTSLQKFQNRQLDIYNTEATGALHTNLSSFPGYICSEYLGDQYQSGQVFDDVRHESLLNLSFSDESFDLIITSDVLEHIPFPYKAFQEIWRVLKPGGFHIFSVPFHQVGYGDDVRAVKENDEIVFIKEPIYHIDPSSDEDILVYTIFSIEMLVQLEKLGFVTYFYRFYSPPLGILGPNGIVFEALKIR